MTERERFEKLKRHLMSVAPSDEDKRKINQAKTPSVLLALASKHKRLISQSEKKKSDELYKSMQFMLNSRSSISKFYKEQQKSDLNSHLKELQEEHKKMLEEARSQIGIIREANEKFFKGFEKETKKLQDKWNGLQNQRKRFEKEVEKRKEGILKTNEVKKLDNNLKERLKSSSFPKKKDIFVPISIPKPSFKKCLREIMENKKLFPKNIDEFVKEINKKMYSVYGIKLQNMGFDSKNDSIKKIYKKMRDYWSFMKKNSLDLEKQMDFLRSNMVKSLHDNELGALVSDEDQYTEYRPKTPFVNRFTPED